MSFVYTIFIFFTVATTYLLLQVYALSRDNGIPFSPIWRRIHPVGKVPLNAVWLCAAIATYTLTANLETKCHLQCHNFNKHNRIGWGLRASHFRKFSDGWGKFQSRTLLFGQSKKTGLFGSIPMDMLYLFSFPFAYSLSNQMGQLQLCTCSSWSIFESNNALVDCRCKEMVHRTCEEHW